MIKKLKKQNGETLVETLVAMLIAVLSMGILSMAIMTATNINMQTKQLDEKYTKELNQAEGLDDTVKNPGFQTLEISFGETGNPEKYGTKKVYVTVYGKEESAFISYDYEPEAQEEVVTP